ncbi:MAG TPA: tetratricopeptide repeat protein, partial [Archangium sp.]|nr:tetratricopeptide repeat protein [Archangium sp.]
GMHRDSCEATRVRGEQSEQVMGLRTRCLERRRLEVKELAEVLAQVDGQGLAQVSQVMERLIPLASCADGPHLAARERVPEDPTVQARLEELQGRLARVRALFVAGHTARGLEQARELAEAAEATGFRPLMAEAWLVLARLQHSASDVPGAVESAHRSARAFLASGQMVGVVQAWFELVTALQLQGHQTAKEQERWLQYLDEALLAAGNPPGLRAEYERRLAYIRTLQGGYAEGLEHARKAVALLEGQQGPESVELANALIEQLRAGALVGRYEEAMAAGQRALAFWKTTVGLEHPSTLRVLNLIGVIQVMTWHLADSSATYEQMLSIMRRMPDTDHIELVAALNNLAVSYVEQGRHAEGEPLLEQALGLLEERQMRGSLHGVICLQSLSESKYIRGEYAEALRLARESQALAEKGVSPQHLVRAVVLTTLGDAELEAGSAERAQEVLERALRQLEPMPTHPKEKGHARFALARALQARGVERARTLTLLAQARKDLEEAGAPAGRLRAAWEAWVKARRLEASPELQTPR